MRGIIRKVSKIDSIFWIIALSALVAILYITFGLPNVDAISRAELDELKQQRENLRDELDKFTDNISDKREEITQQEKLISELKDKLRKLETGSDWESIKQKIDHEAELVQAKKDLDILQSELNDTLDERNRITLQLDQAVHDINNADIETINLSHLVKNIGIKLSKSCETMIQNNFETNCPTYKQLIQLDSCDSNISGKFTTDDNGFFHRGKEIVKNSYKFYWDSDKIRICVDPPGSMENRIKMIYIQPNFDTYTVAGDMTIHDEFEIITSNRTLTMNNNTKLIEFENRTQTEFFGTVQYHDRYIEKCKNATINANNWKFLIGDTIHLMRNNCDRDYTGFEEREVILPEYTVIDITTSPNWVYQQWLKHTEEFCIFKFRAC